MSAPFRERLLARQPLIGTFVKNAGIHGVEILRQAGLDFVVLDAEHAPLGLAELDHMVLAARATHLPCLVRVPGKAHDLASAVQDLGASGVLFPHVIDAHSAQAAVAAVKFSAGKRGFSPSPRAAGYGLAGAGYLLEADRDSSVWCQIEDAAALSDLDAIAIDAVDCLFVGRADLALSLQVRADDPSIHAAVQAVGRCAARRRIAAGIHITDSAEIGALHALGFSVFICGSDQSFLLQQARRLPEALARVVQAQGGLQSASHN